MQAGLFDSLWAGCSSSACRAWAVYSEFRVYACQTCQGISAGMCGGAPSVKCLAYLVILIFYTSTACNTLLVACAAHACSRVI